MENIAAQLFQYTALFTAIFFALLTGNGLVNFFLRYIDHLPIEPTDIQDTIRHSKYALGIAIIAALFRYLPFHLAINFFMCAVVLGLIFRLDVVLRHLKKNWQW